MIYGYATLGYEGVIVSVEVALSNSIPGLEIVGLPSSEVREARERVKIALKTSGFLWPAKKVLVNLSPADIKKKGAGFDLPIALAILEETGQISTNNTPIMAIGELKLNGTVRPVPHIISAASCGLINNINHYILAEDNKEEIYALGDCKSITIRDLKELHHFSNLSSKLFHQSSIKIDENNMLSESGDSNSRTNRDHLSLQDLSYCDELKRVIQVSAAGRHNLHLSGPPGTGKTASAKRLPSLLPPLNYQESLEISKIYAFNGIYRKYNNSVTTDDNSMLIKQRPVRMPHHSASAEGIVGSAIRSIPGEISLAHMGVLILDEAPEFKMQVLQSLREPMDNQFVHISRAGQNWNCPADFQLILTSNLCPCGNLGKTDNSLNWCFCSDKDIFRYWKRIGGAIWDRIDIKYKTTIDKKRNTEPLEDRIKKLNCMVDQVKVAIEMQKSRLVNTPFEWNSRCSVSIIENNFNITSKAQYDIQTIIEDEGASDRGRLIICKVSRTIADLAQVEQITPEHVEEARQLVFSINPSNILEIVDKINYVDNIINQGIPLQDF